MSELDDAMTEHIGYLIFQEKRPFSYRDFLVFEINGKTYGMKHGTFRNKIRVYIKKGEVKKVFHSHIAFYTLSGHDYVKPVTPNHQVIHNNPFYNILETLPFDKQSIHDIHLKFKMSGIWNICSCNPDFRQNMRSKDIMIPSWDIDYAIIRIYIHKSDIVKVIVACSLDPIPLNSSGIIRLSTTLAKTEERLRNILNGYFPVNYDKTDHIIPEYKQWTVTMWHFGRDSLTEYSGEKFSITIEEGQNILIRMYCKEMKIVKRR